MKNNNLNKLPIIRSIARIYKNYSIKKRILLYYLCLRLLMSNICILVIIYCYMVISKDYYNKNTAMIDRMVSNAIYSINADFLTCKVMTTLVFRDVYRIF